MIEDLFSLLITMKFDVNTVSITYFFYVFFVIFTFYNALYISRKDTYKAQRKDKVNMLL